MVRTALATAVAVACLLALAACDAGDEPPTVTPTLTSAGSPSDPATSPTAAPTIPAYLEDYNQEERAAYAAAIRDYESFSDRNAEFYRVGKATPAAKDFYMSSTSAWQSYWGKLLDFEKQGLRVLGRGEILRIRPSGIRVDRDGGGQVDLRVCGVSTGVRVLQNGESVPQPTPKPTTTRVRMVKLPGETSWRLLFDRVGSPC